jgi:hypothetical protein
MAKFGLDLGAKDARTVTVAPIANERSNSGGWIADCPRESIVRKPNNSLRDPSL